MFLFQSAPPKAGTPGVATEGAPQGAAPQAPAGGMLGMFLPFLIFIPILFLMFRRQKRDAQARASLKKGDKVVTNAGIVGELIEVDEKYAKVKVAPGTTMTFVVTTVSPLTPEPDKSAASKESKDAKLVTDKK